MGDFDESNLATFKKLFLDMFEQADTIDTKYKTKTRKRNNDPSKTSGLGSKKPDSKPKTYVEKLLHNNKALVDLKLMMDNGEADKEHTDYSEMLAQALINTLAVCHNNERYIEELVQHFVILRDGFKAAVYINKMGTPDPDLQDLWVELDASYYNLLTLVQNKQKGLATPIS